MKECSNCNKLKPLSEFNNNKANKDGKQSKCKVCKRAYDKKYYNKNPEYFKNYRDKYYDENREKLIKQCKELNVKRRKENPLERYKESCRVKLRYRVNKILENKSFDYCDFLGCDSITFKKHLEGFFNDEIRIDNRNEWELDHIVPLCSANSIKELDKLSKYTNIQILTRKQNKDKYFKYRKKFAY